MQVINDYKNNASVPLENKVVTLSEDLKELSINRKIIIDNNEYFYFYILEAKKGINNQYLVYTESSTDKFYEKGRVISLEKISENWYYLKCEF